MLLGCQGSFRGSSECPSPSRPMPGLSSTGSGAGTRGVSGPPPFPTRGLEGLFLCPCTAGTGGRRAGGDTLGRSHPSWKESRKELGGGGQSERFQHLPGLRCARAASQPQRSKAAKPSWEGKTPPATAACRALTQACSSCRIFGPCRSAGPPSGGKGETCERPTMGRGGGGSRAQHLQASQRLPDGLGSALKTESPSFGAPSRPRSKSRGVWEGGTSLLPWEGSGLGILWPCRPLPTCRFISSFYWAGPEEP